MIIHPFWSK